MKKYKNIVYLFLVIVIFGLSVITYKNISKGNETDGREKAFSEIKFIEHKLDTLLNEMNQIQTRNYDVSVEEISQPNEEEEKRNTEGQTDDSEQKGKESSLDEKGKQSRETNQKDYKFQLKSTGVLTNTENINWNYIKNEIEILYPSIPTITLDLYQLNIDKKDILNFNQDFDKLTIIVKNQNKEETLEILSKLYDYIPKFIEKATDDNVYKIVIQAKANLIKGYSKLDKKNWQEISKNIKDAIDTFSKLLTDTNVEANKQYAISKSYIMLNELQNAVKIQDQAVFLIKYKNVLEEINQL